MRRFPLLLRLSLVCIIALLPGCQRSYRVDVSKLDTTGGPVPGDWVIIHSLSDPENLNLLTTSDAGASEIQGYMYETLTTINPLTLEEIPWIAESLAVISSDNKSYEYRIRRDATYSDGHPVTAADFIFYLKTLKNPLIEEAAPTRGYYDRVDSAEIIDGDPFRLRVVMREPYSLGEQFAGGLYALPKHIWDPQSLSDRFSFQEVNAGDTSNPAVGEFATSFEDVQKGMSVAYLVASGPYMFHEWRRNDRVVLIRNPRYWKKDDPLAASHPDRLVWRTVNDFNAALVALRAGDLDVMPRMEKVQYKRMKDKLPSLGLKPAIYDYPAYNYVGYNADRAIFKDPAVRRALAYAVNRAAIVEKIYFGMARPIQSPIFYKRIDCDTSIPVIPFNLDSARDMLAAAGWRDTDGNGVLDKVIDGKKTDFRFSILLNSGNQSRQQIAIIFINDLRRLGVDASSRTLDWATFLKNTRDGQYDAYIGGWVMGVREGDLYQIWHSKSAEKGGSNYVKFRNAEVDRLIETMRGEFEFEKRRAYVSQIQRIINREQPYTFLVSEKFTGASNARFQNVDWFSPSPCYNAGWWWSPRQVQRYGATPALAVQ